MSAPGSRESEESETANNEETGTDIERETGQRGGDAADTIEEARRDAPDWDDEYVDRVADRLVFNYDLKKDFRTTAGERFSLYGRLDVESRKQFFHPSISYANHDSTEHLFCRRTSQATVADCERLVSLGHELANEWIDADANHYSTDFTFVLVVPEVPEEVRAFVSSFRDRTLIRLGFHGHYEINLVVVAPEPRTVVASREAHVAAAFRLWEPIGKENSGLLSRIAARLLG